MTPRKIERIVYLGVHNDERLKRSLEVVSERLGIPSPIVLSQGSVDNEVFLRAFNRYVATCQQSSVTDKQKERKDEAFRKSGRDDRERKSTLILPKTRSRFRLTSRPALRAPLGELFIEQRQRTPRKRGIFSAHERDDSPKVAGGGRPLTRSLTRRERGNETHDETKDDEEVNVLDAIVPKRRKRRRDATTTPLTKCIDIRQ